MDGTRYAITFTPADQQEIEGMENAYTVATLTNSRGQNSGQVLGYRTTGGYKFLPSGGKLGKLRVNEWDRIATVVGYHAQH